jgi:hypothetical protein
MTTIQRTDPRESERLRRAAAAADQGPADEERETTLYGSGPSRRLGNILDQQDPTNISFPFLRRIMRDHGVSMGLHYIVMPHVKSSFYFEADDARVASFADNLIRPSYGSDVLTILRILRYGYSPAVKNFEVVNPAWTFRQDGQTKKVWDNQVVGALIYKPLIPLRPESCKPHYSGLSGKGKFDGIEWDEFHAGPGHFMLNGQRTPSIDLIHSFWAAHDVETEDGNIYGFPRIAYCAPIFHMYRYIWTLLTRAFENNADPGPTIGFPKDEVEVAEGEMNNRDIALMVGRRKRSGSTIAIPSDIYEDFQARQTNLPKWFIRYDSPETNFVAIQEFLGYLEAMKFRALWISEMSLAEGQGGTSSRNVVSNLSSQRDASQVVLMEQVISVIMEQLVKPAMAINMPWYEGKLAMKTIGFGQDDEDTVRQVIQLAGQQDLSNFGIDLRRLAESRGLPQLGDKEFEYELKKREQDAAKIANQSKPPAVTPTQGRRALVTQTGFGDMVYEQINDPIVLSDDGDFVASLPKTPTWESRQIVDAARAIRSRTSDFLSWAYRDFAIFISKASSDNTIENLSQTWRPRYEKISEFSEAVQAMLLKASNDITKIDNLSWIDDRSTKFVNKVVKNVRDNLSFYLENTESKEYSVKDIAENIREYFPNNHENLSSTLASDEISEVYNFAVIQDGLSKDIKKAQIIDDGNIIDLSDANCEMNLRLLPSAPGDLTVSRTELDQHHLARYDDSTRVVLIDPRITPKQETDYLLALGEKWSVAKK